MSNIEKTLIEYFTDLKSDDSKIRLAAATILGEWGNDRAVNPLHEALIHKDENLRRESARALKEICNKRSIEPLLERVIKDTSAEVRAEAAYALGFFKKYSPEVDPLILALEDSHYLVRQNAVFALGKIARRKSTIPLMNTLVKDENVNVREMVAWALGEINDKRAVPILVKSLDDSQLIVRKNAAFALGRLQDVSTIDPLKKHLLRENESKECAWALSRLLKKRAAIDVLKDAFKKMRKDGYIEDCIEIYKIINQLDKKIAESFIKDMLVDSHFSNYYEEIKLII
ncbi:MAG: HEAT repeat domain-containing protein [Candidatus Heimdallarchaeota archaeon]|nr:HEAT repeat domain-containing protein [Candidatus Heimdallarchaeota archaeon]